MNLHHDMNSLSTPPTSIVDYMRCACAVHTSTAFHYSFVASHRLAHL